jgi:hypothetical protein
MQRLGHGHRTANIAEESVMEHVLPLDQIRSLICRTFAEFGGPSDRMPRETVLIRDGFFCGRRFETDGLHAVWFTEENELKFYDRTSAVVRVIDLDTVDLSPQQRKAA